MARQRGIWAPDTERMFAAAGWFPGRDVTLRVHEWVRAIPEFTPFPLALEVLAEYGGLTITPTARSGITCAPSSFHLDPTVTSGMEEIFSHCGALAGASLFPLGESDHGACQLGISSDGRLFKLFDETLCWECGATPEGGFDNLVRGIKGRDLTSS